MIQLAKNRKHILTLVITACLVALCLCIASFGAMPMQAGAEKTAEEIAAEQ